MPLLLTLVALLCLPLAEIAVFIAVGSAIGVGWTLALVVLATVGGIALVRRQSFSTLRSAQAEARAGRVPEREIVQGAMIVLAGILLVLPGFITDAAGLLLLVPPVRNALWQAMRPRVVVRTGTGGTTAFGGNVRVPEPRPSGVIELDGDEFRRRGDGRPDSPWRDADEGREEDRRR